MQGGQRLPTCCITRQRTNLLRDEIKQSIYIAYFQDSSGESSNNNWEIHMSNKVTEP